MEIRRAEEISWRVPVCSVCSVIHSNGPVRHTKWLVPFFYSTKKTKTYCAIKLFIWTIPKWKKWADCFSLVHYLCWGHFPESGHVCASEHFIWMSYSLFYSYFVAGLSLPLSLSRFSHSSRCNVAHGNVNLNTYEGCANTAKDNFFIFCSILLLLCIRSSSARSLSSHLLRLVVFVRRLFSRAIPGHIHMSIFSDI